MVSSALRGLLGGESAVRAYYDDREANAVAVVEATGTPHPQLTTYATASLHVFENLVADQDIRVELILVGEVGQTDVGNLLATAAFYFTKNRWHAAPGVVFPNVVTEGYPGATVKHLMWVEPFDFDSLSRISVQGLGFAIHGLQAVPITDAEWALLKKEGFGTLERALLGENALHYDLSRVSVV
jgi:hypothetical protein